MVSDIPAGDGNTDNLFYSVVFRFERESPASHARKTTRDSAFAAKLGKEKESLGGEKQFDFSTKII